MHTFADTLRRELVKSDITLREIAPKAVLGRIRPSAHGFGKWLGYIDRFLLFPAALRRAAAGADLIHICDHGNALYTGIVGRKPVVVTCHDMLAVRGAFGEVEDCPASFFGRLLQKSIVRGLRRATRVACVSQYTLQDARRILASDGNLRTVINGLPNRYGVISRAEVERRLAGMSALDAPFVLHVGSNHARKNREGVIRVFAKACEQFDLRLVCAGQPLSEKLSQLADALGVRERIVQIVRPPNDVLEALYNRAVALVFPSRYEGFGWPPIEAQACGCPVVASNIAPFTEVLEESAELFSVENVEGMATAVVRLATDHACRRQLQERGFKNVQTRFETSRMIEDYLKLYQEVSCLY
jgi:glycosyltransferase involved in cell wall biosynthesis